MALVDPYAPCPCGSGEKFKWCCQKVESYAERAQKLFDGGQFDAALQVLDEGLRKQPDNPWLTVRKALILINQSQAPQAELILKRVIARRPEHIGAQALLVRVVLEVEGPTAGAAQLQQAMSALPADQRPALGKVAELVGMMLHATHAIPAALAHFRLAERLRLKAGETTSVESIRRTIESNGSILPWLKNPDKLAPAPEGLSADLQERFEHALGWAEEGLWSSAAAAFATLAAAGVAVADRNAGLCRLWMGDDAGAVAALRRYIAAVGPTEEAVDLEALCQLIEPTSKDNTIERVQLIWTLRDRAALLAALRADPSVKEAGRANLDPTDETSPEVDQFLLLDRPALNRTEGLHAEDIPRLVGRVLVGLEIVALEIQDDDQFDATKERFIGLAGRAIAPAHPRTKTIGEMDRANVPFQLEWLEPEGLEPAEAARLEREAMTKILRETWPNAPMPYLGGRTPLEAARSGDARVALRAAVDRIDYAEGPDGHASDLATLRTLLGLDPEPEPEPETVEIEQIHLARLRHIPAARLSDEKLAALFTRAIRFGERRAAARAALALADRPALFERGVDIISVYTILSSQIPEPWQTAEALAWVERGRRADPPAQRAQHAPLWDMMELRLRARAEEPERWVGELAALLDHYAHDERANAIILEGLIHLGLIQMSPHPDRPGEFLLDSRPLQHLLSEYGPKITTATGRVAVAVTKPTIWTPSAETGTKSGLWTPSTGTPPATGDTSKLIIPGR
jgi:tetratricopeptide (TPR) repeat protein